MIRLTALGTLSIVVALLLVLAMVFAFVPFTHAQTVDSTSNTTVTGTSTTGTTNTSGSAPTDMSTTGVTDTTSPGLPNTGVGGDAAMNLGILLASGLVVVGGIALLARRFA
jgi:hypothetical protein